MSKTLQKSQVSTPLDPQPVSIFRKFIYAGLWLFWIVLLVLALGLSYAWLQRYDYLEQAAKQALAENNIAAEFDIFSIGRTELRLNGVVLRDLNAPDAPPFFSVDQIDARYDWREAVKGKIDKLTFTRPSAMFEVDEKGTLIAGWLPPSQTSDQDKDDAKITFPKDGLWVKDGQLNLQSPYGAVNASVEGHVFDLSRFEADLEIEDSSLSFKDYNAIIGGPLSVSSDPNGYQLKTDLQIARLTSENVSSMRASVSGDLSINNDNGLWSIIGPLNVGAEKFSTPNMAADGLTLRSGGRLTLAEDEADRPRALFQRLSYKGEFDINARNFGLTQEAQRKDLAQTMSLSGILSKSPILKDFSPELTRQVADILAGSDVSAKLAGEKNDEHLQLIAREDVIIAKDAALWRISADEAAPLLNIKTANDADKGYRGTSDFDFKKSGPLPLTLSAGHMEFAVQTPTQLLDITGFSGQVRLPQTWRAAGAAGRTSKLLARKADINFTRSAEQSQFTADTNFTLSGEVPGGYAQDFNGAGRVNIKTVGEVTRLEFTPKGPLSYQRLDLASGWILEDGDLYLDMPFIMDGPAQRRVINLAARALKMRVHDEDVRDFQTEIASISGQGILELTDSKLTQDWALTLSEGRMMSAEFPITDTNIFSPKADIKVILESDEHPVFEINSPQTQVSSSLVSADNIAVSLAGTPENLTVDYDAKLFRFADPALPHIPMVGQTRLIGTKWTGESIARLPEDPDTPIDISFEFEDGVGRADVEIETLNFTRKRLQPQNLVQSLSGKIGDVEGTVSTSIKLEFGEGIPLKSYGSTTFNELDFGVLAGSVKGLNGTLDFTSFFPLETSGRQTLRLSSFDPGFPLPDGEIEFELLPGKMKIHRAEWVLGNGVIFIEPLIWDFEANENRAVLAVENVPIQDVLKKAGDSKLEITGEMSGRLPILISGVNVDVQNGTLSVPNGGNIRFSYAGTDLAGAQNQAVGVAFDALKDFEYNVFELDVNGPLDGLVRLRTVFSGYNQDVYEGQPFEFDVELEGELLNLMRELNPETQKNRALKGDIVDLILNSSASEP